MPVVSSRWLTTLITWSDYAKSSPLSDRMWSSLERMSNCLLWQKAGPGSKKTLPLTSSSSSPAVVRIADDKWLTSQFLRNEDLGYVPSCFPGDEDKNS